MPTTDFDHVALSTIGFQTKLKLKCLHEQWQKVEIREKQRRPKTSIKCGGDNTVLRSSRCLTHCTLSLRSEQRHEYSPRRYSVCSFFPLLKFLSIHSFVHSDIYFSRDFILSVPCHMLRQSENFGRAYMLDDIMKTVCLCCVELKPSPRLGKLFSCEFTSFERCGVHPTLTSCFSCTFFLGGSILRVWTAGSQVLREEKLVRGVCWWSAGWGEPVRRAEWHSAPLAWPKCPVHRGLCDPHKLGTLGRWFPKGTLSICIPFLACLILPVHGVAMYFINYGAECYLVK